MRIKIASLLLLFASTNARAQYLTDILNRPFDYSILQLLKDSGRYDGNGKKTGIWNEYAIDSTRTKNKIVMQKFRGEYADGQRTGEWRVYKNYQGQKPLHWDFQESSEYKNGKLNGWWNYYQVTGHVLYKQFYADNKRDGKYFEYYSGSKQVKRELDYQRDTIHGMEKLFYESGKPEMEATIKAGKYEGVMRHFYENGNLWAETEYKNGLPWTAISNYAPDGKPQDKGTLKDGNGTLNTYDKNGTLANTFDVTEGKATKR